MILHIYTELILCMSKKIVLEPHRTNNVESNYLIESNFMTNDQKLPTIMLFQDKLNLFKVWHLVHTLTHEQRGNIKKRLRNGRMENIFI